MSFEYQIIGGLLILSLIYFYSDKLVEYIKYSPGEGRIIVNKNGPHKYYTKIKDIGLYPIKYFRYDNCPDISFNLFLYPQNIKENCLLSGKNFNTLYSLEPIKNVTIIGDALIPTNYKLDQDEKIFGYIKDFYCDDVWVFTYDVIDYDKIMNDYISCIQEQE